MPLSQEFQFFRLRIPGVVCACFLTVVAGSETLADTILFDDTTDTIRVTEGTDLGTAATIEARIKFTNEFDQGGLLFNEWTDSQEDKQLSVRTEGATGYFFPINLALVELQAPQTITLNAWHHVAYVLGSGFERLFIDGMEVANRTVSSTENMIGNGSGIPHLGAISRGTHIAFPFRGYLDTLRVSNIARYDDFYDPPTGDLDSDENTLLLYNFRQEDFSEVAGTKQVQDLSGQGRHGTLGVGFEGATSPSQVGPNELCISFDDPVGDQPAGIADVLALDVAFDTVSGTYEIEVTANSSSPFEDDFRLNIHLYNPDTGTTACPPSLFSDTLNDFQGVSPTTTIVLSGISTPLQSWKEGDRVATNSTPFGNPDCTTNFLSATARIDDLLTRDVIASGDIFDVIEPCKPPVLAMAITKTSTTRLVTSSGQVVPYNYVIRNTGQVTLHDVALTDDNVDAPPVCLFIGNDELAVAPNPASFVMCSAQHTVTPQEFEAGGTLDNLATATSDETLQVPVIASLSIPIGVFADGFEADCPCWTISDITSLPLEGSDSFCEFGDEGTFGLILQEGICEHSYSTHINYEEATCTVNRFSCPGFPDLGVDLHGIGDKQFFACLDQVRKRCEDLGIE